MSLLTSWKELKNAEEQWTLEGWSEESLSNKLFMSTILKMAATAEPAVAVS